MVGSCAIETNTDMGLWSYVAWIFPSSFSDVWIGGRPFAPNTLAPSEAREAWYSIARPMGPKSNSGDPTGFLGFKPGQRP